ncbi:MAG: thioredoxin [Gemmataceae bacterium]|nr:thioredoxin [Gemmataceae bacterium]
MTTKTANLIELTSANFQDEVLEAEVPVLVDFWGGWCRPCLKIAPLIDELAESAGGRYRVGKVNVGAEEQLTQDYQISGIPTLLIFKGGEVVRRFAGVQDRATLVRALQEA